MKNSKYQELIAKMSYKFQIVAEKKEEEPNVIDLTTEEALIKPVPEMIETTSSSKGLVS